MNIKNKTILHIPLILLCLGSFGMLIAQEIPFDMLIDQWDSSSEMDMSWSTFIRETKISDENICYITTEEAMHYNYSGHSSYSIGLRYFGPDNEMHSRQLVSYDNWFHPLEEDFYTDFVTVNNGIAFSTLDNNLFRWHYFDINPELDIVSTILTLPGASFNILKKCQMDNTHCLVLFQNTANSLVYAAYLDVNATTLWDCSININTLSNHNGTFSDAVMLDQTHFVLGFTNATGIYEIFTVNNLGEVTGSVEYNVGTNPLMGRTNIPGRLTLSSTVNNYPRCYKFENQVITPVVSIEFIASDGSKIPVMADASGIILAVKNPGQMLCLCKYNWEGTLIWSAIYSYYLEQFIPQWIDMSPTGNVVVVYLDGEYADFYYTIAKVLSNGDNTGLEEETIPQPEGVLSAYPNPFRDRLTLSFELKEPQPIDVKVYNIKGQLVKSINNLNGKAGTNDIIWDGYTQNGVKASNGIYFVRINNNGSMISKRVVRL